MKGHLNKLGFTFLHRQPVACIFCSHGATGEPALPRGCVRAWQSLYSAPPCPGRRLGSSLTLRCRQQQGERPRPSPLPLSPHVRLLRRQWPGLGYMPIPSCKACWERESRSVVMGLDARGFGAALKKLSCLGGGRVNMSLAETVEGGAVTLCGRDPMFEIV